MYLPVPAFSCCGYIPRSGIEGILRNKGYLKGLDVPEADPLGRVCRTGRRAGASLGEKWGPGERQTACCSWKTEW